MPEADPLQLAMLSINPATAHVMLSRFVDLKPGDWVAQPGANSAVGLLVIALAHLRGLKTLNVVRRDEAADEVRAAGGDHVLVSGPVAMVLGTPQTRLPGVGGQRGQAGQTAGP